MKEKQGMLYIASYTSPLGKMIMKSVDGEKLYELFFEGQKYFNEKEETARLKAEKLERKDSARKKNVSSSQSHTIESYSADDNILFGKQIDIFSKTKQWLDIYFSGKIPDFMPAFDLRSSDFRLDVWKLLLKIPHGQTITYGDIANKIAKKRGIIKMSSRAVGGAVGHNPIAIIVPCHRVVGANGSLTGYGGGIERKVKLLEIEQVDMSKFFVPNKGNAL